MNVSRQEGNWSRGREFFQTITDLEMGFMKITADPLYITFEGLNARIQLLQGLLAYVGPHFVETGSDGVVLRGSNTKVFSEVKEQINKAILFYNSRGLGGSVRDRCLSYGLNSCANAFLRIRQETARMNFDFGAGGGV